jgi:acyl-CoA dehydrogenase
LSVLNVERPDFMQDEEIRMFEDSVGKFFDQNAKPADVDRWRENHCVDRDLWTKAGDAGLLGLSTPARSPTRAM